MYLLSTDAPRFLIVHKVLILCFDYFLVFLNSHSFLFCTNNKSALKWSMRLLCWSFLSYYQLELSVFCCCKCNDSSSNVHRTNKSILKLRQNENKQRNKKKNQNEPQLRALELQELFWNAYVLLLSNDYYFANLQRLKHIHNQTRSAITITATTNSNNHKNRVLLSHSHTAVFPIISIHVIWSLCVFTVAFGLEHKRYYNIK